jgi:hypothetical protein
MQKARLLKDRLGLASFKTKHGWERLSLDIIEPRVEQQYLRSQHSRPNSSGDVFSDSSSGFSDRPFPTSMVASSPLGAPIFSDPIPSFPTSRGQRKRPTTSFEASESYTRPVKRPRSMSAATHLAQAPNQLRPHGRNLPQSSPVYHRHHAQYPVSHSQNLSFVSETPTMLNDPSSSDSDDVDLPTHSFAALSAIRSSPPRTPPPSRRGVKTSRQVETGKPNEECADLLLYLATSPQPNTPSRRGLHTPLANRSLDFGLPDPKTPGSAINYYDFINFTPSPSQGLEFYRTPNAALAKTPLVAREARRRLNYDSLVPPTGSPALENLTASQGPQTGLGMELGGELVS